MNEQRVKRSEPLWPTGTIRLDARKLGRTIYGIQEVLDPRTLIDAGVGVNWLVSYTVGRMIRGLQVASWTSSHVRIVVSQWDGEGWETKSSSLAFNTWEEVHEAAAKETVSVVKALTGLRF